MAGKWALLVALAVVAVALPPAYSQVMLLHPRIELELGKGVREGDGCFEITDKTRHFSSQDSSVYVVIRATVPCGRKRVYKGILRWYAPSDSSTPYREETIKGLDCGHIWCIWRALKIANTRAANLTGQWKVTFSIPGVAVKSLTFSISSAGTGTSAPPPPAPRLPAVRPHPPEGADWPEVIAWARPAVVFIEGETTETDDQGNRMYATGSGVIISPDGYILTAAHLVHDISGEIKVLVEESQWYKAKLIRIHPNWDPQADEFTADVALLKIEANGLAWLPLGDSDSVSPEEEIRVLGYPQAGALGLGMIPAAGKVLGVRYLPDYSFLQFQADPFDKGHSGGPVIDIHGEVIGIAMGVFVSKALHVSHQLAVAINTAKDILPPQLRGKLSSLYALTTAGKEAI